MLNIVSALSELPVNDGNFECAINKASDEEIRKAIERMIASGGRHKTRIMACERELRKRGKNK